MSENLVKIILSMHQIDLIKKTWWIYVRKKQNNFVKKYKNSIKKATKCHSLINVKMIEHQSSLFSKPSHFLSLTWHKKKHTSQRVWKNRKVRCSINTDLTEVITLYSLINIPGSVSIRYKANKNIKVFIIQTVFFISYN